MKILFTCFFLYVFFFRSLVLADRKRGQRKGATSKTVKTNFDNFQRAPNPPEFAQPRLSRVNGAVQIRVGLEQSKVFAQGKTRENGQKVSKKRHQFSGPFGGLWISYAFRCCLLTSTKNRHLRGQKWHLSTQTSAQARKENIWVPKPAKSKWGQS